MTGVEMDLSEVHRLSADLGKQPEAVVRQVRATMARAGVELKARMRAEAAANARLARAAP